MNECRHDWQEEYDTDRDGMPVYETVKIVCTRCKEVL